MSPKQTRHWEMEHLGGFVEPQLCAVLLTDYRYVDAGGLLLFSLADTGLSGGGPTRSVRRRLEATGGEGVELGRGAMEGGQDS